MVLSHLTLTEFASRKFSFSSIENVCRSYGDVWRFSTIRLVLLVVCFLIDKMASKKRKVDSECRVFKDEWTWKYFFTPIKDKPVCLICNEAVAVFKEFNLSRHFKT